MSSVSVPYGFKQSKIGAKWTDVRNATHFPVYRFDGNGQFHHNFQHLFVFAGGREGDRAGEQVRRQEMDADRPPSEGPHRETVPRTVAQSPQPENQEERMDRTGGRDHLSGASSAGQPMGADSETVARPDG